MSRLLSSSGAAGAATLLSRILGFIRESAYAAFMGTGPVADAFFLAFQAPNVMRRLLGEGALTAALVPVFREREKAGDERAMWDTGRAVAWAVLMVTSVLCLIAAAGITVALRYVSMETHTELMFRLMRIMLGYIPLVCVAATFIGMLNARGHYFLPALGATMLNVVMLASIWWLAPLFGASLEQRVFGLAVGAVIAGFAQAAFQLPSLRRDGFSLRWINPWSHPSVHEIARRMGPAVLGVAAFQVNTVLCQTFAFSHGKQIVAPFNYAVRLLELPQGVAGISLATVLLSELSGFAAEKRFPEFRDTLRDGLRQMAFLTLLPFALLVALAEPMIRLLFERGNFDPQSTARTTVILLCLSPSLLAFSTNALLARAFYALGDTSTPMKISLVTVVVNLFVAFMALGFYPAGGLGIAATVSSFTNCALLLYALRLKLPKFAFAELLAPLRGMLGAAVAAGLVAAVARLGWTRSLGHDGLAMRLGEVFVPLTLAVGTYFAVAHWLGLREVGEVWLALRRRRAPQAAPAGATDQTE
jgi:putative peptidoglycan lipid II flippase